MDDENERPIFTIDGVLYSTLPYLDPNFRLDNAQLPQYRALLKINEKEITNN